MLQWRLLLWFNNLNVFFLWIMNLLVLGFKNVAMPFLLCGASFKLIYNTGV